MKPVRNLNAPNQTLQKRTILNMCNSGYSLYNQNGLIIDYQNKQSDYIFKDFESKTMQHPKIDLTCQNIYRQTNFQSEIIDFNDIVNSIEVIYNNKNENHPT